MEKIEKDVQRGAVLHGRAGEGMLVRRGRRGAIEAERDREVLAWIGRFRFVTAAVLAERFGISVRRANSRISALEAAGLLVCRQEAGLPRAVFLSRRGSVVLGLPVRRPPRLEVQRTHELAIADLATRYELQRPQWQIFTERECRRLERGTDRRYSVDVSGTGRAGSQRRWPDLVIEYAPDAGRTAVEIELAPKTTDRLERIINGYAYSDAFTAVWWFAGSAALAVRLARLCGVANRTRGLVGGGPRLTVDAWDRADRDEIARMRAALEHQHAYARFQPRR